MTPADRFVSRLRKLDVAGRTALKAAATRPHDPDVAAHDAFTAAWWPIRNSHLPRDPCRHVAALYFWHPKSGGTGNLGSALARVPRSEQLVKELLAAPFAGLPGPLLTAVQRLAAARVAVDWPQLLEDLREWGRPAGGGGMSVQERWAESWLQTGGDHAD